jgi:V/A-type H+-transporting ATPase subunit I
MIVAMKKVAVITQRKDEPGAVEKLAALGVLHVEHQRLPQGQEINILQQELALLTQAIGILSEPQFKPTRLEDKEIKDLGFLCRHAAEHHKRLDQLQEYSYALRAQINQWRSWGDFAPQAIPELAAKNIFIKLYQIPLKELKNLPPGLLVKKISASDGVTNCVIIGRSDFNLNFKEIKPPKISLFQMEHRLAQDNYTIDYIKEELKKDGAYLKGLLAAKSRLENELVFQETIKGAGEAENLAYLVGYVPEDKTALILSAAQKEQWGIWVADPQPDEEVPTLLKNPAWVQLIQPLFKILEILPGYRELDVSLPFLLFFSIFFGMIIGDAGYGLVYMFLTFLLQRKFRSRLKDRSVFLLFYLLSFCAIVWGVLTATFFGQEWLAGVGVKPLLPALNEPKSLQTLCFFLGATHLSLAHGWRAIVKFPDLSALADAGWIMVLWAAFFLARMLILGQSLMPFTAMLAWGGISLVILFSSPQKNIFKAIGNSLNSVSFGLNFMSTFTDVVSYVRLFAVGLAGVAIADTFNNMARGLAASGAVGIFFSVLVVVFGHALDMVLGPVSVLVHGVRLNVLEFSSHTNISWSGIAYKPLKK